MCFALLALMDTCRKDIIADMLSHAPWSGETNVFISDGKKKNCSIGLRIHESFKRISKNESVVKCSPSVARSMPASHYAAAAVGRPASREATVA